MLSALRYIKLFPIKKIITDSTPPLVFLHTKQLFIRSIYKIPPFSLKQSTSLNRGSYAVTYLINSCGLSPEMALSACEKVKFGSPERPDSVLNLLRSQGFTKTQISTFVMKCPQLLLANPQKILLPKVEFFQSIGVSRYDLARILSKFPSLLQRSLVNQIVPNYKFLKSVIRSDKKVVSAMKRTSWVFSVHYTKYLVPNIAVLREFDVSESSIGLLLTNHPEAIMKEREQFKGIVNQVKEMGFDPFKSTFVLAVHAISGKGNNSIWDRCYETYRKWGWSEEEILSAFKKQPQCMVLSEKKITRAMEFLVNKMGRHSKDILRYPCVMLLSLEKRIIPRLLVVQVLLSKGLLKKDLTLGTILMPVEKYFLKRFVIRYEEEVPQLLSVYQGKVDVLEL